MFDPNQQIMTGRQPGLQAAPPMGSLVGTNGPRMAALPMGIPQGGGYAAFHGPNAMRGQVTAPFQWGPGGQALTPEQIEMRQRVADALLGADTSPIGHWAQGAARMAQAGVGALQKRQLDSLPKGFATAPGGPMGFRNPFMTYTKGGGLY